MWCLCKSGRFSYDESPRTPPLKGNSLHRRNNSVERPWGILSLFTTCSQLFISEFTLPKAVTQTCGVFVNQVVFLTVNHRGPLPLRKIHSTDETIVWRDPGGSWACLRPVHSYLSLTKAVTQTCGVFVNRVVFLTVNHRGPLPLRKIHSTDETIVWRDPRGSWACLRPVHCYLSLPNAVTQTCGVFENQVVFLTVNHRGPFPLREIHSTDETIVWRDPRGSWACLRPVHKYIY